MQVSHKCINQHFLGAFLAPCSKIILRNKQKNAVNTYQYLVNCQNLIMKDAVISLILYKLIFFDAFGKIHVRNKHRNAVNINKYLVNCQNLKMKDAVIT